MPQISQLAEDLFSFSGRSLLYAVSRIRRRPRIQWENYITMDFQEVGWVGQPGLLWLRIRTDVRLL
jgi:hypothetical protein